MEEVASSKSNSDFGWSESFARDACYFPLTIKRIFGILKCLRLRKKMDLYHSASIHGKYTSSTLLWWTGVCSPLLHVSVMKVWSDKKIFLSLMVYSKKITFTLHIKCFCKKFFPVVSNIPCKLKITIIPLSQVCLNFAVVS